MLNFKKLICMSIVVITLLCILISPVSAAIADISDEAAPSSYQPVCFGDIYADRVFSSLDKAKATYGYDFSYYPCAHYYNGGYYNYYYTFSDGSKMYFLVDFGYGDDDFSADPKQVRSEIRGYFCAGT